MDQFVSQVFRPRHGMAELGCSHCEVREHCLPAGLSDSDVARVAHRLVAASRSLARGATLFHAGDAFDAIYAVRTGFFKTITPSLDDRQQVTGFQMAGEFLGLDGLWQGRHEVDAIALEDARVCVIPIKALESLSQEVPSLQAQFRRAVSREIVRHQDMMLLLGRLGAEERLAAFLLNLVQRQEARGYSAVSVLLRMSRTEIASYLGLTIATISRTLSRLHAEGLLCVNHRRIDITNPVGLKNRYVVGARRRHGIRLTDAC